MPRDSSSKSETLSSEGSSAESPLGGSRCTDPKVSQASASLQEARGGIRIFPKVLVAQGLRRLLSQLSHCQVPVVGVAPPPPTGITRPPPCRPPAK